MIEPRWFLPKRLGLFALTLGYVVVIRWGGFTLTTFVFLALAMLLLGDGRRKGLILALAAVLSIGGYLLFVVAFSTRFPEGPFEDVGQGARLRWTSISACSPSCSPIRSAIGG